jgi:hypothetical protein
MSVIPSERALVPAPPWFRARAIRFELGPCRSARLVLDTLGQVLARTGLVARHVDVDLGFEGYTLVVDCDLDLDTDVVDTLAVLYRAEPRPLDLPTPARSHRPCSLAP